MAKVTTIPATISRFTATPINERKKRRTAAYARVSTDSEEQLSSYENQLAYYTEKIMKEPGWTMAGVFADEGITGNSHFMFQEMNNDVIAQHIETWLGEHGLN